MTTNEETRITEVEMRGHPGVYGIEATVTGGTGGVTEETPGLSEAWHRLCNTFDAPFSIEQLEAMIAHYEAYAAEARKPLVEALERFFKAEAALRAGDRLSGSVRDILESDYSEAFDNLRALGEASAPQQGR